MVVVAGVDVGKANLDVSVSEGPVLRFDNTARGITRLLKHLMEQDATMTVCESTGGYERLLVGRLRKAEIAVRVAHTSRVRAFARACGYEAKTDPRDAQVLSRYGQVFPDSDTLEPEPGREELRDLLRRRRQLVEQRVQEINRLDKGVSFGVAKSTKRHIAWLDKEIAQLDKEYQEALQSSAPLARRAALYRTVPGVGPLTAAILVAHLPELGAWPALVSRELFDDVQQAMRDRAPTVRKPGRVGSKFLLSGLLKCGVCGRPYTGQGAKSGQFAYYICGTLYREGAGTCEARYLNAPRVEDFVVEKIRERILNEETIVELVTLVAEEIDAMAGELSGRLEVIDAELRDVQSRLQRLYEALETSELTLEALSPRILSPRHREEQLSAAREDAAGQLEQRRVELPTTEGIKGYVADFREFLQDGTFPERKALIRNFVEGIEVTGDEAVLTYTIPMPNDGVTSESASVLDFVKSGPLAKMRTI